MKKLVFLCFGLFYFSYIFSQRKQVNCQGDTVKYVSIGKDEKGIGFGNPSDYTGLRLSLVDKNCITNGIALNMFTEQHSRKTNGVDIGFSQSAKIVNGVSIGLLGNNIDYELRGFGFGTFLSEALNIYGVSLTGGFQRADKFEGACIAGLMYRSFETKGMVVSGLMINNDSLYEGVAITAGVSKQGILNGIGIALVNWAEEVKGLQLGLINKTDYLKGVQIGLINVVAENPKWARVFPLINIGFKSNPINLNLGGSGGDIFASSDPCRNGTLNYETTSDAAQKDTSYKKGTHVSQIISNDSLILSINKSVNPKSIEFYLDERLVYPVKEQQIDTSYSENEVFVKIKKSDLNFIKVIYKEQKKCMEASWKPNYSALRIESAGPNSDAIVFRYTNHLLEKKTRE